LSTAPDLDPNGNCARFAACPLTEAGTPTDDWLDALTAVPALDLSGFRRVVVVAAHPDDETFGFGAASATLAARGLDVQVVVASDGAAAQPGLSAAESRELAATRHVELVSAVVALGIIRPPLIFNFPDGALGSHVDELAEDLIKLLPCARTLCVANWRGDGHPDHEAVGQAAARAARACGVPLVEYPVWMWHWASPADPDVPWERLAFLSSSDAAATRKVTAARCYQSQMGSPSNGGGGPVLPDFVVDRLLRVPEVVFR
jgi:LmbE family N-acetylglucosaminyl deacetylase